MKSGGSVWQTCPHPYKRYTRRELFPSPATVVFGCACLEWLVLSCYGPENEASSEKGVAERSAERYV